MMQCLVCEESFEKQKQPGKKLSHHVRKVHRLTIEDYILNFLTPGTEPFCLICKVKTRRSGFTFKKFCKEHSKEASTHGGKIGGQATAWNKGLTKSTDNRIHGMKGKDNSFYGKRHSESSLQKMRKTKRITEEEFDNRITSIEKRNFKIKTGYNDYYSRQRQYLEVHCTICSNTDSKTLQALERGSRCTVCYPISTSIAEKEIYEYIKNVCSVLVIQNDRKLITPKEIDILVPSRKLCIEYEGLYWHSDAFKDSKPRNYHLKKTKSCKDKSHTLFRIYEDQWRDKREICISMLNHKLGITENKIHARKCVINELPNKESAKLLQKWHIYGNTPAKLSLSLIHKEEVVSVLTLRVPRQKKYRDENLIEIARYSSKLNTIVNGGLSKLLKYAETWAKSEGYKGILSYADLDNGTGNCYSQAGFEEVGETGPSYWYTDCNNRFNRFSFRATSGKSETQIALESNVHRIYGSGSQIFIKMFKQQQ
jgi:hypothetical protein